MKYHTFTMWMVWTELSCSERAEAQVGCSFKRGCQLPSVSLEKQLSFRTTKNTQKILQQVFVLQQMHAHKMSKSELSFCTWDQFLNLVVYIPRLLRILFNCCVKCIQSMSLSLLTVSSHCHVYHINKMLYFDQAFFVFWTPYHF